MNLTTTITHESEAAPGAKFTVRRLNYLARCERDLAMIADRARLSDLTRQINAISDEGDEGRKPHAGKEGEFARLNAEHSMVYQSRLVPAYIRAGLVSVEGLDVDGKPADATRFCEWASDPLIDEVFAACYAASDLSESARKNSQSPGSSDAPGAGQMTPTTADAASA